MSPNSASFHEACSGLRGMMVEPQVSAKYPQSVSLSASSVFDGKRLGVPDAATPTSATCCAETYSSSRFICKTNDNYAGEILPHANVVKTTLG